MTTQMFHLSDVLTMTTGRLVSTRHMDGVYDITSFLTQDPYVTTIGLAINAEFCKTELLKQFPQLADIAVPDWSVLPHEDVPTAIFSWLEDQYELFGEELEVAVPDLNEYSRPGDLEYVAELRGGSSVDIVVIDI